MSNQYIQEEISYLFSSDEKNGAINRSVDGSSFTVNLDESKLVPYNAKYPNISVQEAQIWWTIPNIITGKNDKLYIFGPNTLDVDQLFTVTLPQGLYDLNGLNEAILRELEANGAKIDPEPLIFLSGDESTQKVELKFNYPNMSIDFTQPNTPYEILGFDQQIYLEINSNPLLGPNVANFNQVNYFLMHSDISSRGIRLNNSYSQIVAQVPIDVPPGSQITYKPFNPAHIPASELIGANRTSLRFWLTDDENRLVNTNGENYSFRLIIRYYVPIPQ